MKMVLASQSPRRRQLMSLITPQFRVQVSQVDESQVKAESPAALAEALARAKALAVAAECGPEEIVIGSDTVVDCDGQVLGKPADARDAARMLRLLSGREHQVHTGVCLACGEKTESFVHTSRVEFYPLSEEEIAAYIATGEPFDKAGAYGIQGGAALFCKEIRGDFFSIMGLPVSLLARHLRTFAATCPKN